MDNGEFQKALYSASAELSRAIWNELMTPHPEKRAMLEKKARECEEKALRARAEYEKKSEEYGGN
jgi:hypothetical protein